MSFDAPVMIAGGGPIGMTLALELARNGVRSIVVERNPSTTRHPKMDLTNGRSMELYRRLGISNALRSVGVPIENAFDVMWATSPSGFLLHNFRYPSAQDAAKATAIVNDGSGTAEPGMRISQIILEPVLREAIDNNPLIDVRFGWKFESLEQDHTSVIATVTEEATGIMHTFRTQYLVGCDGGGSRVRRILGIELDGEDRVNNLIRRQFETLGVPLPPVKELARVMLIHFKSAAREILNPWGVAWHLQTPVGSLVAQDDDDTWTLHIVLPPGTEESTLVAADMLREFVGKDFDFEILVESIWSPRLVIADSYRQGRVFMAGDAVHQVIPSGGYGMNTGVGDAIDLGWKLAATINGWGSEGLLNSYEWEREYIAEQNREGSERHFWVRMQIGDAFMAAIADGPLDEIGPKGDARRKILGERIAALGNAENECWGIEHGYGYYGSPVVAEELAPFPAFDPEKCVPTTYPGTRLPHVILSDGTSLIDKLGQGFTLLAIGDVVEGDFAAVAAELNVPFETIRLPDEPALGLLERKLILVRPDQHVAWRGNAATASGPIWQKVLQR